MVKKRQHYVWRYYLKSWSNKKDQIYTLLKNENKIIHSNLMGVAQEKYFYSLEYFSPIELKVLKDQIISLSNDHTLKLNLELYEIFTEYSRLIDALEKSNLTLDKKSLKEKIEIKLLKHKHEIMEDFHMHFENFGKKILNVKNADDLKFLNNDLDLSETLLFISTQYVRTKKVKFLFQKKFSNHKDINPKFFNILSFVIANGLSQGMILYKDIKFKILINISSIDFFTCDQPVINIKEEIKNELGEVLEMELIYPISPKILLIISYDNDDQKYSECDVNEVIVGKYNSIFFDKAHYFLFSTSKTQLNRFQ